VEDVKQGTEEKGKEDKNEAWSRKRVSTPRYSPCLEASARLAVFDKEEVKQHKMSENNDGMYLRSKFEGILFFR